MKQSAQQYEPATDRKKEMNKMLINIAELFANPILRIVFNGGAVFLIIRSLINNVWLTNDLPCAIALVSFSFASYIIQCLLDNWKGTKE